MKGTKNLIFGIHPVSEAIYAGKEIDRVFLKKDSKSESFQNLLDLIHQKQIPYQFVPNEKLNRISRTNHQGVIAQLSLIEYKSIDEIVQRTYEEGRDPFIVVLDRITDVRNFGAICRTAECAGVDAILIPEKGGASITPDAIKTSAGALNRLPICRVQNLSVAVQYLKESGIKIVAATEKAVDFHHTSNLLGPIAIIMGSEENGISPKLINIADTLIKIPMVRNFDSLNVGVACGIVCFEAVRQRLKNV